MNKGHNNALGYVAMRECAMESSMEILSLSRDSSQLHRKLKAPVKEEIHPGPVEKSRT